MKKLYQNDPSDMKLLAPWQRKAMERFEAKMKDKERPFPCIPATQGFAMNQFRYGFAGDPRSDKAIEELGELLAFYTESAKKYGTYTSLLVFFETPFEVKESLSTEHWEQLFWRQLNGLAQIDELEWPEQIPTDPHHPLWEFCYHGERYFMYCGTPSHTNRKSRHSEDYLLAITPRWVLEEFGKQEEYARKIKSQVRKRLENYDSIDIHPALNSYGNPENYEWKQYYLHDDDTALSKCPFHRNIKASKKI